MKLYGYFRSSATYRVRIALNLKGIPYNSAPVHLVRGEQFESGYRRINPQSVVPTLDDHGTILTQSLAIMEYLEETRPRPPLLPADAPGRARVRGLSLAIACEIHPLNNLRVLNRLRDIGVSEDERTAWYRHWVAEGLDAVEAMLAGPDATGRYCHGELPTMADCCLVPQLYNARRFGCDLAPYPTVRRIDAACRELAAFEAAEPARQTDAE